ncbi:MAG: hypothetical protein JSU88_00610 [Nitrospinaceae bacterium]|jgi:hypothetical protein|nr:MAG: hypothetical protein JSU88_00610 [Nitrospinaceae bacterium]
MLEFLFVLYLIFLFIFPMAGLAATLGLATTYKLYGTFQLFSGQPEGGRRLLYIDTLLAAVNFLCSIGLALLLALLVHLLIFPSSILFVFNFIFCAAISVRWFDFTHAAYRRFAMALKPQALAPTNGAAFVVCRGYRSGGLLGGLPAFLDAGLLHPGKSEMLFDGVFLHQALGPSTVAAAGKKSFEKIRLRLKKPTPGPCPAEALTLTLKENFYPFRSREARNRLLAGWQNNARLPSPPGEDTGARSRDNG